MPLPEPGETVLGKYQIDRRLGAGGMGTVFAAHDVRLGGLVALKFLLPELAARPDIAQRFEQEARAGRTLTSVHVAKVHDIDKLGEVPFIVMDHLEGETLAACLTRRGRLPVDEAVDFVLQACEPLNEAHLLGIVHRDLKPANLFLTTDKRGATLLKVLDFGISKFENLAVTSSESALGTPYYMAPEQIEDSASVDARADVWSLGVVLFELLTGKRPFEGTNRSTIHVAIKSARRPKVRDLNPEVPPRLEEALDRALALLPENRFASVEAFAGSIAQFGTRASAASLDQIQRLAERAGASPEVPAPSDALAPVDTAPGRDMTSLAGSVAETPALELLTPPPRKARSKLLTGIAGVVLASTLGVVGVRSRWLSREAVAASIPPVAACVDGATPACEAACTAKVAGACHDLARALQDGKGAAADPVRAATLYKEECDSGGMRGCNNLGNLYDVGKGVPRDREKALSLFQQACKGDVGAGCANVGNAFAEGKVVAKDDVLAHHFYKLACDDAEPFGCANLSVAYFEGRGVEKNATLGYKYGEKACAQGVPLGCVRVATATILGAGTAEDVNGGLGKLDAMCTAGVVEGCLTLVDIYDHGLGRVQPDPDASAKYQKKACALHDPVSCARPTYEKTVALTSTTPAQINASWLKQCLTGNMMACEMYGKDARDGIGMPKDPVAAAKYLKMACDGGRASACVPAAPSSSSRAPR